MTKIIFKGNILNIYFEANAFKNSFKCKLNEIKDKKYQAKEHDEQPVPLCVTLLAFACELYMKFLICMQELELDKEAAYVRTVRGHKLNDLFGELNSDNQNQILNLLSIKKEKFEEELEKFSNDFITWRYIYESDEDTEYNSENLISEHILKCDGEVETTERPLKIYMLDFMINFLETLWNLAKYKVNHTDIDFGNTAMSISMEGTE